ncbi:peptidylprolyl isomerase [Candidatus Pacearchaeota archaeon]|nr:peptidylprolyl isomerase [Candidatus Pacearchaeota archaeon]
MAETVSKNDFIELVFTGKANGEIFDTTKKQEAKEMGLQADVKPVIASVGNEMVLKGLDEQLAEKEVGKIYTIKLTPEKAFGKRDPTMIRTMPLRVFHEKQINPVAGMSFQMDQYVVKILSVNGGRVMTDFNNPMAGKDVEYEIQIKRKITDDKEKVNALQDHFFRQRFEFEVKDKKVIFKDSKIKPIITMLNDKLKAISGLDFEVKEEKQEEKRPQTDKKDAKKDEKDLKVD